MRAYIETVFGKRGPHYPWAALSVSMIADSRLRSLWTTLAERPSLPVSGNGWLAGLRDGQGLPGTAYWLADMLEADAGVVAGRPALRSRMIALTCEG